MKKPLDTTTFHFVNYNSHNRKTGDCVYRALANVFQISWEDALKACVAYGLKKGISPNDTPCYSGLLAKFGIDKEPQPRKSDGTKMTGNYFCKTQISPSDVLLAHIGGHHIVAIRNCRVEDIWNSTEGCIGNYWRIPQGEQFERVRNGILAMAKSL